MKKITIAILSISIIGCQDTKPFKKPFVIVYKNVIYDKNYAHYQLQDANGNTIEFSDSQTAYKIGDTIK